MGINSLIFATLPLSTNLRLQGNVSPVQGGSGKHRNGLSSKSLGRSAHRRSPSRPLHNLARGEQQQRAAEQICKGKPEEEKASRELTDKQ